MNLTVEPERQSVRIDVTVPAGNDRLTLSRVGPSGTPAEVRAWAPGTVVPGAVVARDFEVPLGVPLTYTADMYAAAGGAHTTETATVTVLAGACDYWLTDIVRSTNSQIVEIEALDELAHDVPTSVHEILDRRAPIVVSDIADTPTFELLFLTDTDDDRLAARGTLGNGVPVLLRTIPADGIGNFYFSVLGFSEQRIVKDGTNPARRFVVEGVQIERPDADLFAPAGPAVYSYVKATYQTYADLKAERTNYDAVLYDWTGADPSDIAGWLPSDV